MSLPLMTAVWALDLPSTDKLVLLALADHANEAGCCWPSMPTLAKKSGLTDRSVRAAVGRLCAAGHLSRIERMGTSVLYTVHPGTSFPPEAASPRKDVPPTPEGRSAKPSRTLIPKKASPSQETREAKPPAIVVPDWIPADAWNGWLAMRKGKGAKLTPRAAELAIAALRKLADDGHPPGAVLDQSTLKSWTALYPIKENHHGERFPASDRADGGYRPGPVTRAALAAYHAVDANSW